MGNKVSTKDITNSKSIIVKYTPSSQSETQLSQISTTQCDKIYEMLKRHGRRAISDYEIGLAIIHCSMEKFCNPDISLISVTENANNQHMLLNSKVLAQNTPINFGIKEHVINPLIVPDSDRGVNLQNINKRTSASTLNTDTNSVPKYNSLPDTLSGPVNTIDLTEEFIAPEPKRQKLNEQSPFIEDDSEESLSQLEDLNLQKHGFLSVTEVFSKKIQPAQPSLTHTNNLVIATKPRISHVQHSTQNESSVQNNRKRTARAVHEEDDEEQLFVFKELPKKRRGANVACAEDLPQINPSQMYNIPTQNSQWDNNKVPEKTSFSTTGIRHDAVLNNHEIRPSSPPIKAQWLSRFNRLKINEEPIINDELDAVEKKPDETTLWIESVKKNIRVESNLSITKNRSYVNNTNITNQNSSYAQHTSKNSTAKNFKCFVKRQNYIPQTKILITKPFYADLIQM